MLDNSCFFLMFADKRVRVGSSLDGCSVLKRLRECSGLRKCEETADVDVVVRRPTSRDNSPLAGSCRGQGVETLAAPNLKTPKHVCNLFVNRYTDHSCGCRLIVVTVMWPTGDYYQCNGLLIA